MTSAYAQNSGIELIGTGDQSGTWGDTTNLNLQIIDRITNGVGAISLSGTTYTLTTSNAALSEGQYKVLVFGGSPSGTNTVTVSPNTGQHFYIVKNNSGQSVIMTQGSGGNVTIANGASKVVYCDGAGSTAAVVDVTSTLSMSNVTITGGAITGITSLAVTGQASFADGSASAPSIAHTGDLNAGIFFPAADTVAVATSGSERMRIDAAGNLGLGVTPSAWTSGYKVIDISGGGAITSLSNNLFLAANAYDDSGWKYKANGYATLDLNINGEHRWYNAPSGTAGNAITFTQAMTLDASGNLGIGTSSPAAGRKLDVRGGDITVSRTASATAGDGAVYFGNGDTSYIFGGNTTNIMAFAVNSAERMRIGSAGQVGIGGANYGTSGQVLTSGGSGAAPSWANAQATNVQTFTSSGTWTKPSGAKLIYLRLWGAGGGGGSGKVTAAGSANVGGGGGGGGAVLECFIPAADVGSTVSVIVGAGGTGGAAAGTAAANGNNGIGGGVSIFVGYKSNVSGGGGGAGGNLSTTSGGTGGNYITTNEVVGIYQIGGYGGNAVIGSAGSTGDTSNDLYASGAGGGGGGDTSANAANVGGAGGGNTARGTSGGAGGATAGAAGGAGGAYAGGGGGASSISSAGGAGGAGGLVGGGGGGGGGARVGFLSGAGGAGANGYVEIYTW